MDGSERVERPVDVLDPVPDAAPENALRLVDPSSPEVSLGEDAGDHARCELFGRQTEATADNPRHRRAVAGGEGLLGVGIAAWMGVRTVFLTAGLLYLLAALLAFLSLPRPKR